MRIVVELKRPAFAGPRGAGYGLRQGFGRPPSFSEGGAPRPTGTFRRRYAQPLVVPQFAHL